MKSRSPQHPAPPRAGALALAAASLTLLVTSPGRAAVPEDGFGGTTRRLDNRPRSFTMYGGSAAASVLDTTAGAVPAIGGSLTAAFPLGKWLALELVGSGGVSAARRDEPNNAWVRLALGLRVERTDAWGLRPYGALRLVHIHFAPTQTWHDHPGASILGDSSHGLEHRSGVGVGLGLSHGLGASPLRMFAELEPSWVPIGHGPQLFAALTAGFGFAL